MRFSVTEQVPTRVDDQGVQQITDRFIHKRLPSWITGASAQDIEKLHALIVSHKASQDAVLAATAGIEPLDRFAIKAFSEGLANELPTGVGLDALQWQTKGREPVGTSVPRLEDTYKKEPALHRLMQNFAEGATPLDGSGLVLPESNDVISGDIDEFVTACRKLDAGATYQTLLKDNFRKNAALLVADKLAAFKLALHVALLKQILTPDVADALQDAIVGSEAGAASKASNVVAYPGLMSMLGAIVHEALFVQLRGKDKKSDKGLVVYLPGDALEPLRWYPSSEDCVEAFVAQLKIKAYQRAFLQRVALQDRRAFFTTLQLRLQDAVPDLQLEGKTDPGHVLNRWVDAQIARVESDASLMLVPTAQADANASRERWAFWRSAGWDVAGLAGFFIPAVGAVLLAKLVADVCADVFEGVQDWAKGHNHEALGHALNVAQTAAAVAVTTGIAVGVGTVVKQFTRSAFVDGLDVVGLDDGTQRLWHDQLSTYQVDLPEGAELDEQGRYSLGRRHWIRIGERYHEIHKRLQYGVWRLRHPLRENAYGPLVQCNSERFWHVRDEAPISWSDASQMLGRLWPQTHPLDQQRARLLLQVACSDVDELRGILVDNRALPANLRETLRRFEASERIDRYFASLAADGTASEEPQLHDWCKQRPELTEWSGEQLRLLLSVYEAELRQGLFKYLTDIAPTDDPAVQVIMRDFPGLTTDYATELASTLSVRQREEIELFKRLPLKVMNKARRSLQFARLYRVQQGLALRNAYSDVCSEVLPFLLSRLPNWPSQPRLELRQGSWTGRLLGVVNSSTSSDETLSIMVHKDGEFHLYGASGEAFEETFSDADDVFQAIVHWLGVKRPGSLERMGIADARALRQRVIEQLPNGPQNLMKLFGWRTEPRWFNPGQDLGDGRSGYSLGGCVSCSSGPERRLRRRIEVLYHGSTVERIELHLARIVSSEEPLVSLALEEHSFALLNSNLDAWITEARRSERPSRLQVALKLRAAWRKQLQVDHQHGAGQGFILDLSAYRISTLPALHHDVDFTHITTLIMVHTPLRAVPGEFFACMPELRRLNLSNNSLDGLPGGLAHLVNLKRLNLAGNRIRIDEPEWAPLSALQRLEVLDLSINPLRGVNIDFSRLVALRRLTLAHCGLTRWPQGLEACSPACRVDLSYNFLSSVPEGIMQMPYLFRSSLRLSFNNHIDDADLLRLYARPLHAMHPPEFVDEAGRALRRARQLWVPVAQEHEQGAIWNRLFANQNSRELKQLLGSLEGTAEYQNAAARLVLTLRVWELLRAMDDDSELLERVLLQAGEVTCADSVIERFSELYLMALVSRANRAGPGQQQELLNLGRGMFRLDELNDFIKDYIVARRTSGRRIDEVEIKLLFHIRLASDLSLPGVPANMMFASVADVSDEAVSNAFATVRAAETEDALASFLSDQGYWSRWLELEHPEEFHGIADEFEACGNRLEEQRETLSSQAFTDQWETLMNTRKFRLKQLKMFLTRQILEQEEQGSPGCDG